MAVLRQRVKEVKKGGAAVKTHTHITSPTSNVPWNYRDLQQRARYCSQITYIIRHNLSPSLA